ncbi:MAG TPA: ACT domain-containing protein [Thermoflexus sp.]|nr:ACT domain-containing protein [Thermoflexus sp.]
MEILIANSDTEIAACYYVMRELRPHITEESFVAKVRVLEKSGYMLAYLKESGRPVAVAGFRIGENLAWGRFLYVDDLVTLSSHRSRGFGSALLSWLTDFAEKEGCAQLHLDSGVQRKDAHRFYEREGLQLTSYHFSKLLASDMAFDRDAPKTGRPSTLRRAALHHAIAGPEVLGMTGEADLKRLLTTMRPVLHEVPYVFCSVSQDTYDKLPFEPLATFREHEGITIIVTQQQAMDNGLPFDMVWACITLSVQSSLSAVGFLAEITGRLARAGISVNVVSAYYHDHLFVPWERRWQAMDELSALSQSQ